MPEGSEVELAGHAKGGDLRIKREFGVHDNATTCYTIREFDFVEWYCRGSSQTLVLVIFI